MKTREATFEYLGCAGWLIRCGGDAVLTAPFFSNPPLRQIFSRVQPDVAMVEKHIGNIQGGVEDVRVVIAGHAHYDHIMDLPVVMPMLPKDVPILGGPTVCNSLSKFPCIERLETPRVRVHTFDSQHGPHVGKLRFLRGHYRDRLEQPPQRPSQWLEGEIRAYLIDFLDDGENIALRVYYNDSAPSYPFGLPDEQLLAAKEVDVAILAVSSFKRQKGYPKKYLELLKPKRMLLGHWESFFRSADLPMKALKKREVQAFIKYMPLGRFTLPERHEVFTYRY